MGPALALAGAFALVAPQPGSGADVDPNRGEPDQRTGCDVRREALRALGQLAGVSSTDLTYLEPFIRGLQSTLRSLEARTWSQQDLARLDLTVDELEKPELPPIVVEREWDPDSGGYEPRVRPRFLVRAELRAEKAYADGALLAEALLALERLPVCPLGLTPEGDGNDP